ncbi:hypothetical protein [Pedobacter sp. P26]|uniref:hypothetical protein n=1 Tax=Pedobacter sp. P26 TaxID=3423956 RepID=UPI003D666F72
MNLKSIFTAILAISTSLTFAQQQAVLANRQQATIKEKKQKHLLRWAIGVV